MTTALPDLPSLFEELEEENVVDRLWAKDPSLWTSDPVVQGTIRQRLGWLDLPGFMADAVPEIAAFVKDVKKAGCKDVVLLGMGGSSLCPEVLRQTFGTAPGGLKLHVLDTTDPGAIAAASAKIVLKKTLFLVASKSGGTIEVMSLFKHFWGRLEKTGVKTPGAQFVAITDPGTSLEKLARDRAFRKTFLSRADVGGRFSALTFFGLVPAALIGVSVEKLLDRAARQANACREKGEANPGLSLGAWLGAAMEAGRDKMTIVTSKKLAGFGVWVEQLVAESTGKQGTGVVPIDGETLGAPTDHGADRVFVHLKLAGSADRPLEKKLDALVSAGHPVLTLPLATPLDLAQEFFRWEFATAVVGQILGINPFDEPNVSESKANTTRILQRFESAGALPEPAPTLTESGVRVWAPTGKPASLSAALNDFLARRQPGDYVALMAYLTPTPVLHRALQTIRARIARATGLATTLGYGPRFLHSTGQLHKGGAGNGLFIQITGLDAKDLDVPGAAYGFSILKRAQALGDFEALGNHKLRAIRFDLSKNAAKDLARLAAIVK